MSDARRIQAEQQAGHTKLTAVTLTATGRFKVFFVHLRYDEKGAARIPDPMLQRMLRQLNVARGETYTIG
jgi:hypothetical protein